MHAKPDLRVFLKWMIAGSGSVITDVIPLKQMTPSSYFYNEHDGRYRLYLGEFCTIAGLKLFPQNTKTSCIKIYSDTKPAKPWSTTNMTTSTLISHLMAEYIGIVDFSCVIEPECKFSTHDDGECHFDATTEDFIRVIVDRATPPVYSSQLWETLKSNRGCYVTIDEEMQFNIYPNFDTLIESKNAG